MSLFKRVDTVFVQVRDLDKSIKWYTESFDLKTRWTDMENGYATIDVGETPITLLQTKEFTPADQPIFNFYSLDIEKAYEQLKSKNIEVDEILDYGDVKAFEFKDPDGNILEVCHF